MDDSGGGLDKPADTGALVGAGSQTLMRGLDILEAIGRETMTLGVLAERLDLSKSTTHRLLSALIDQGYVAFKPRSGYRLGAKLLLLGTLAQAQADLVQIARPHLEDLAARIEDTVHLGVLDGDDALYVDKVAGRRRIEISSRVGDRYRLSSTGLGKALILDHGPAFWRERLTADRAAGAPAVDAALWMERMAGYAAAGVALDLEENEHRVRCAASPVRDAAGAIVGAVSVSGAAQYMSDARLAELSAEVSATTVAISRELGYDGVAIV